MYSYILKRNHQNIPILVKRKDGNIVDYTDRLSPATLQSLYVRAIVHDHYAILHYADTESDTLNTLLKGHICHDY